MRYMPVMNFNIIKIFIPFLQVSFMTNVQGKELSFLLN